VIKSDDNVWYDLPTGTYNGQSTSDMDVFYEKAKDAVLAVVNQYNPPLKYELIVAQYPKSRFKLNKNTDKSKLPK
jgi:hypothetical protein